jgi:uncharacterized protein YgiM (DUF1202 family)
MEMAMKKTDKSAVVTNEGAVLRQTPSLNAPIITDINKGERVQVLDNEWTRVSY